MQEKVSIIGVWCGYKNPSLGITIRHHSASLVMPISRDGFFYPHYTPMKDTYNISFPELCSWYSKVRRYVPDFRFKERVDSFSCVALMLYPMLARNSNSDILYIYGNRAVIVRPFHRTKAPARCVATMR